MVGNSGYGYGDGDGFGYGYGDGGGYGYGYGGGDGGGDGYGYGYGGGGGDGYGGFGFGYGYGYGDGGGDGYGYGDVVESDISYECRLIQPWGYLRIGCEVHSLTEWIEKAEEIDAKHGDNIADQTRALAQQLKNETHQETTR